VSDRVKTFVALDSGVDRETVQAAVPDDHEMQIVGFVDGLEESWSTLQETSTDVVVVACAGYSDRALFLIEGAIKQRPERPVVVLCETSPNGFFRRVFEAGADDIVTLPVSSQHVRFTLQKAVARRQGATVANGVALAPLICILGPKGGTGKTLTACNLAVSLARGGRRTALVDLDLQFGDVGLALGLTPERTVYDLAKSGGSLDGEKLDGYLVEHSSGVRALLAPTRPDHASSVRVEFLRDVYTALRATNDFVVVDTAPGFTPEVIASIDSSTDVVLVGSLDSLSLKNTKLGFETLELMGYDAGRIRLVLNRADTRVGIARDDVTAIVGRPADVLVPSDREISCSVNEGTPIVLYRERSEAARAFHALAELLQHEDPTAGRNGRGSRLQRHFEALRGRRG
jgi:pilus assembly protein CpaE